MIFIIVFWIISLCCGQQSHNNMDKNDTNLEFILETERLPADGNLMPTLSNGHIGFTTFSDSVHMNGLYNGHLGLSHRARIPNWSNIQLNIERMAIKHYGRWSNLTTTTTTKRIYALNTKTGIFTECITISAKDEIMANDRSNYYYGQYSNSNDIEFRIEHRIYAHRYYDRAIVNEIDVIHVKGKGDIVIKLNQTAADDSTSKDITFNAPIEINITATSPTVTVANDRINCTVFVRCGHTNEIEDPDHDDDDDDEVNGKRQTVCVLWNHVPEEITSKSLDGNDANDNNESMQVMSYRYVMTVDGDLSVAKQEIINVLNATNVLESHIAEWNKFWNSFQIIISENMELSRVIYASLFYLVSSLPSLNTSSPANLYYGLSPTGLGRGSSLDDYEGHSFWDTEIWMQPTILLMNPKWSAELLNYRMVMLPAARRNAHKTGVKGARFPWESAFTGCEVTQPCCPLVAQNQLHISGDISFAIRNHFSMTHDFDWLNNHREIDGGRLAVEIAKFWASRIERNESSGFNDIKDVMGPDEDHDTISNNGYTNVVAGYALYFADFASCLYTNVVTKNWSNIARHLALPYDPIHNYHPQYDGYHLGETIKQADAILIGYPLLYDMDMKIRCNDLHLYENVTRSSGPAMTWAMHTIGHLDVNENVRADAMFLRSYRNYVRPPFNVWSEMATGEKTGAINFLTGSGGFLQAILNGYAGIKVHIDRLVITNPRLPNDTAAVSIKGFKYLGSSFTLRIGLNITRLFCTYLNDDIPLECIANNGNRKLITVGHIYTFSTDQISIKRQNNPFKLCPLPDDVIGIPFKRLDNRP